MESIILTTPIVLIGFITAFALLCACFLKKTHAVVLALSMLIFIASASYAVLAGAALAEVGTVSMIFFLVSAVVYVRGREGK